MIATLLLILLGIYLGCGLLFAVPFVIWGAQRIDPHAVHASWGFRLLLLPGASALWPLLLRRWLRGVQAPPEACTAHRCLAQPVKPNQP